MFKHKHYVPILKWKRAEQKALKMLNSDNKKLITPLISFVMPKPNKPNDPEWKLKSYDKQLEEIINNFKHKNPNLAKQIVESWGKAPIFIDFSLLYTTSLKIESVVKTMLQGNELGATFIPVLNLSDDIDVANVVCSVSKKYNTGLCLRIVCPEFTNLVEKLKSFLESYKISENNIDLLIDIKEIENSEKYNTYITKCCEIPNLNKWRTFTFASGAFPVNLSKCKFDEENIIPRLEWNNWLNLIKNSKLKRIPSFSDYTIQYPIYDPSLEFHSPTTSIKYTLKDSWFILKGKKSDFKLYLLNAKLLSGDDRFFGKDFSYGDNYIFDKGKHCEDYIKNPNIKGTGGTESWLTTGVNHHLVCTVDQIANLP